MKSAASSFPCANRNSNNVRQRGQALTEFLVAAVAILPIFLLIPVIARYQEVSHAAQMASRYMAFDATSRNDDMNSWKPEGQLADEVRRRFFSNPDAPIRTNDRVENIEGHRNFFWSDPSGKSLIEDFSRDVTVSFGPDRRNQHVNAFTALEADVDKVPFMLHDQLDLHSRGIYGAQVAVKLINLPALEFYKPFDRINWNVERGTSILINPWTAKNSEQIESKIKSHPDIYPTKDLSGVNSVVGSAITTIELPSQASSNQIVGPKLGALEFWRDVVPSDRLTGEPQ